MNRGKEDVGRLGHVSRADISAAKGYLVDSDETSLHALIPGFLERSSLSLPNPIVLRGNGIDESIRRAARGISLQLACVYALWELVGSGDLMPSDGHQETEPRLNYTTVVPGSGGSSGGWSFPQFKYTAPDRVYRRPLAVRRSILVDGDLYLRELNLPNLHPGVAEALSEAARSLRYDLFTPALAMLGAACEGEWSLVGEALGPALPKSKRAKRIYEAVTNGSPALSLLLRDVLAILEDRAESNDLAREAGRSLNDIRAAFHWADTVRESRNVLHWNVTPTVVNSFEKVATLMLATAPHLGSMEAIRAKAILWAP